MLSSTLFGNVSWQEKPSQGYLGIFLQAESEDKGPEKPGLHLEGSDQKSEACRVPAGSGLSYAELFRLPTPANIDYSTAALNV